MNVNLAEPDFFQNPYPYYARLRATGRPYWLEHTQETVSGGLWLFSRHAHAETLFKQAGGISKCIRAIRPPGASTAFDLHVLHRDGADHLRLRRLVADYFSPRYIATIESRIAESADALVRRLRGKSHVDLIADFAEQLPLRVIASLVGVPEEDMPQVRAWSLALGDGFDSVLLSPEVKQRQRDALQSFLGYVRTVIECKRRCTDDSLLGHVVAAEREGQLDADEAVAMIGFLLFAGHETTISLIGNALWLLLTHPEQWRALQQDPKLLPDAVEEILRYESPEQRSSFRVTTEFVDIGGTIVEPGQQVGIIIGSANRDEEVFEDPDTFNIRRDTRRHLAFGVGLHNCLGKNLSRVEARIALHKVLEYLPSLRLIETNPVWRKNSFFRGLASLPADLQ